MPRRPAAKRIRYAVIGLGHIAQAAVLPAFKYSKRNSVLGALVSGDPTKLKQLGRRYGVVLALESLVATLAGWQLANVEFRLAALAAFAALALLGPQQYALDLKSPKLASWSRIGDTRGPASKAA